MSPGSVGAASLGLAEPGARRPWVARLLSAVGAIHAAGLLHRDLKDANILLEGLAGGAGKPVEGRLVVIDFGLACLERDAAEQVLAGTPYSMAPELFIGGQPSRASDLWAVGLVLAEAFLGRRLFMGREPGEMAAERAAFQGLGDEDAARLQDPHLVALLDRLLHADPLQRPESAEAARAALPWDGTPGAGAADLKARLCAVLAGRDPCRLRRLDALKAGSQFVHLAPERSFDLDAAHRILVEHATGLTSPTEVLRVRLEQGSSFPASKDEVSLFVRELSILHPLVVGWAPLPEDASEEIALRRTIAALPRVTTFEEPAPTAEQACAVVREWLGERPLLESRLRDATPGRWGELKWALAELLRDGVVGLDAKGVTYDESRLPPEWPLSGGADPAQDLPPGQVELLNLLALSPWPLAASALESLASATAGPIISAALKALVEQGLLRVVVAHERVHYEVADGRLRRQLLAHTSVPVAQRAALTLHLAGAEAASQSSRAEAGTASEHGGQLSDEMASAVADVLGDEAGEGESAGLADLILRAAVVFRGRGRFARASALLRRGLAGHRRRGRARSALHRELVEVLTRATQMEEAQAALDEACAEDPEGWMLVVAQARVLEVAGRVEEGLGLLTDMDVSGLEGEEAALSLQLRSDLLRRSGKFEEAARDLRDALRCLGDVTTLRTFTLLLRLGTLEFRLGRPSEAIRYHERCLEMISTLQLEVHRWNVTFNLGRALWSRGERRRGLALQEESVRLCEAYGQNYGLVTVSFGAGTANLLLGRLDAARRLFDRALRLARSMKDDAQIARALNNLGMALSAEGRREEAEASFAESLALREALGDVVGQAAVVLARGPRRLQSDDRVGAAEDLARARSLAERVDGRGWAAEAELLNARLCLAEGRQAEARASAESALEAATERALDQQRLEALELLALTGGCDLEDQDFAGFDRSPEVASLAAVRAGLRRASGRTDEALSDLDLALSILGETPSGPVEAGVLLARAELDLARLEALQENEDPDYAIIGELVSRAVPDVERARELVDRFDLKPLEESLVRLEQGIASMDDSTESRGLGALARRLRDFERLVEINKLLTTEKDTQKLLNLIVDSAIDLTGAARGFIILFEGKAEEFRAARNIDESTIRDPQFQVSHSVARQVAREGKPILTENAIDDPRLASASSISELKLLSILCVPLRSRDKVLGALYLDHPQVVSRFEGSHLATVTSLSEQAAIAVENSRLSQGLEESNRELQHSQEEVGRLNEALQERLDKREAELEETLVSLEHSQRALALRYDYGNIVTQSARMHAVLDMMDRVTDTDFAVVIYGESGTGKELMARAIHFNGSRRSKNFMTLNCAALPENLIESELFGHVRGSFTGAERDREGLFARADGGTLFLDEIGDMSLDVQKRLLRVLQEGEFIPVGGRDVRKVDVRILCATHRNLTSMTDAGTFRDDLLYRLDVARIELPPLRERPEDIALLVPHFLERHGAQNISLDAEGLAILERRPWPGNVRELENFVMTMLLFGRDHSRINADIVRRAIRVREADADLGPLAGGETGSVGGAGGSGLGGTGADGSEDGPLKARLEEFERAAIRAALASADGNKSQAARDLGVSVRSLYKMIERLGL